MTRSLTALMLASLAVLRAHAGETGAIEGSVRVGSQLADRQSRFKLYADPTRPPKARPAPEPTEELDNVVIYVESVPAGTPPPARRTGSATMRQEGMEFVPHVLPVVVGETVEFENADPLFHNVFSLSKAAAFDLGRYPSGKSRSVRFTEPGVVKVFCHIHSDMSAVVLVLDNPFFATPGRDGRFSLDGLPPGTYRVTAWHSRARPIHRTVRVEAGTAAVSDFDIPLVEGEDRS